MNPSDEQLQRKIAELLGWTELGDNGHGLFGCPPNAKLNQPVPNWPTDRNASYELPVEDFDRSLHKKAYSDITKDYVVPFSAYNESLAWPLYKGWRWMDCDSCEGEPHGVSEDCTDCNGEGGEWVKA